MTFEATVIAHSASPYPDVQPLITMRLRYPKFIHGEFMTHRAFSRNASSSRAIPVSRMIEDVKRDPAMPVFWGKNQPGMQAAEEVDEQTKEWLREEWRLGMQDAIYRAERMHNLGAHKQIVNRVIEPWCHINTLVTATDWSNFFALRRHPDAQPEIRHLADLMWEAQQASTPTSLTGYWHWHLPFVDPTAEIDSLPTRPVGNTMDWYDWCTSLLIKLSVARCARVSYLTHEGKAPNAEEDLALYDRLVGGVPRHASPCEHQAAPDHRRGEREDYWEHPEQRGNLGYGWRQYRKMIPNECL